VQPGKIVTLLGANGAGKTSLLRAVSGILRFHRGSIPRGSVEFYGQRIDGLDASAIVRKGMAQVMEGRRIFAELTVDENLTAGAYSRRDRGGVKGSYDKVLDLFPVLNQRRRRTAGYLSGGEQQMLAMGER
jgi:branched-chain amino acid transport system ATP-binding protein